MPKSIKSRAEKIVLNNLEYFDEVVEAAIVNLLEDEVIDGEYDSFVEELQYLYDIYVVRKKYGKQLV
ncbi:hypothetical protein BH20ACI4_BH20ACI4_24670 [soil metagenome]